MKLNIVNRQNQLVYKKNNPKYIPTHDTIVTTATEIYIVIGITFITITDTIIVLVDYCKPNK